MCYTLLTVAQQSYNQGRASSTAENSNISFPPRKKNTGFLRPYCRCCCLSAWREIFLKSYFRLRSRKYLLGASLAQQSFSAVSCTLLICMCKNQPSLSASLDICADFQQDLIHQFLKLLWFDFLKTALSTSRFATSFRAWLSFRALTCVTL